MNEFQTENIIESYEMDKINVLRSGLGKLCPKSYPWLIAWMIFYHLSFPNKYNGEAITSLKLLLYVLVNIEPSSSHLPPPILI